MDRTTKIVFILGAGFSFEADIPLQSQILGKMLKRDTAGVNLIKKFIESTFGHTHNLPLEDVFTALDRSIARDESLRNYRFVNFVYPGSAEKLKNIKDLVYIRELIFSEMTMMFQQELKNVKSDYIKIFAEALIRWRLDANKKDQLAILSLNWDTILDNALGRIMGSSPTCRRKKDERSNKLSRFIFIDHCMMDKQLFKNWKIPASLTIKARGYINLKLLKLHGSFNWLRCPNCDSLFVGYGDKFAEELGSREHDCYICQETRDLKHQLRPFLLSPTFLKNLDNVHYRSIWWNAGFELSEATHIVFIGYSLPLADFEFRYLLGRYVRQGTIIKVIDYAKEPPECSPDARLIMERYQNFFGPNLKKKNFYFQGAKSFLHQLKDLNLSEVIEFIEKTDLRYLDEEHRERNDNMKIMKE